MDLKSIYNLVVEFRRAIDEAYDKGLLDKDKVFRRFPKHCCGDTCELLAEYLRVNGIDTIYVCGDDQGQLHAWLVINDERVKRPKKQYMSLPQNIVDVFNSYSANTYSEPIDVTRYSEGDLREGIIVDIAGDQFGETPVYFDYMDSFHKKYEFEYAYDFERLRKPRPIALYKLILDI